MDGKCKWARVPNGVEVDNYGFTIVDLNVAGYKNDPWILAGNIAQVFYITDPVNAKKEIVLSGKQRVAGVDNVTDPEEYNQFDDVPPFGDPKKVKQVAYPICALMRKGYLSKANNIYVVHSCVVRHEMKGVA